MQAGGDVVNGAGGTIAGKWIAVQFGQVTANAGGTLTNYGTIFASDGTNGAAVWIHGPGEIINNAGATIAGGPLNGVANGPYGIVAYYQTTIINRGSIGGTQFAVDAAGTSAVGNLVEMAPGASFGATVMGAKYNSLASLATLALLSGSSVGTISGFGSQYQNFGNISVYNGALWNLGGTVAAGTNVAFSSGGTGSLTFANPGSMAGTISGFGPGETIGLAGIANASSVTLGAGNVLTVNESGGQTLTWQLSPTQSFTGDTFSETVSGTTTDITVTNLVTAYYEAVLRVAPSTSVLQMDSTALSNGSLTASGLLAQLLSTAQATTIPALLAYDFMTGVTPSSGGVTYLTTFATDLQSGNYTFTGGFQLGTTPGEYNLPQFSVLNTYVNFCATDVQISGNPFTAAYGSLAATASTANRTTFFNEVYTSIFGFAPAASTTNYFVDGLRSDPLNPSGPDITNFQFYVEYAGSELGAYGAIAGVLLWTAETSSPQLGPYPGPVTTFLTEAATSSAAGSDTAPYGSSLLSLPATAGNTGGGTVTANAAVVASSVPVPSSAAPVQSDPSVIIVSGSGQLIDPGAGGHTIQFLSGASGDTLVLHASGVDQISGFDPATDVLDVGSLLAGTGLNLTGDIADLSRYLTVVDQGTNALLRFDPTGHGGGSTVAVLQGLGGTVTGLNTLVTQGAIKAG
jgi:hypothetical protein